MAFFQKVQFIWRYKKWIPLSEKKPPFTRLCRCFSPENNKICCTIIWQVRVRVYYPNIYPVPNSISVVPTSIDCGHFRFLQFFIIDYSPESRFHVFAFTVIQYNIQAVINLMIKKFNYFGFMYLYRWMNWHTTYS